MDIIGFIIKGNICCNDKESLEIKFFPINELSEALLGMHLKWLEDVLKNG
ncbi:hypothetical protein [Metabacillus fastidiosus]